MYFQIAYVVRDSMVPGVLKLLNGKFASETDK